MTAPGRIKLKRLLEDLNIKFRRADLPIYVDLINYSVGFNPRSMKRVFNSMLLLLHVLENRKKADELEAVTRDYEWTRILFGTLCMQNSYPAFFKYLNKTDITDDLFLSLRNIQIVQEDERFSRLRKELKFSEDDELLERFVAFTETFYRALQLKNDSDKNKLSDDEIKTLKYVLSSSSIVSTESSEKAASITREQFIELLDEAGRSVYRHVFEFLDCHEKDLVLNWGSKGFSANVKIDGGIVCLFYGYLSNSPYKQCLYTEFNQIAKKVKRSESIVEYYKNEISALPCFIDAGTNKKWVLSTPACEDELAKFLLLTGNVISMIKGEMSPPVQEKSQKCDEQDNADSPEAILIAAT